MESSTAEVRNDLLVGEPFDVKDKYGDSHRVKFIAYKSTVIIATTEEHDTPISVICLMDTGEIRAMLRDNDFRGEGEITIEFLKMVHDLVENGTCPVTEGRVYGWVHPTNKGSNDKWLSLGAQLDKIMIRGKEWFRWSMDKAGVLALGKAAHGHKRE